MNNKEILNEISRINDIMKYDKILSEATTPVMETINKAIREALDEFIKLEIKKTIGTLTGDAAKKALKNRSFTTKLIENNVDEIAEMVSKKLPGGRQLSSYEKGYILNAAQDNLDDIVKQQSKAILGKGLVGRTFDATKRILGTIRQGKLKPKSWWKKSGIFKKWGWVNEAGELTKKGKWRMRAILGAGVVAWWMMSDNDDEPMPEIKTDDNGKIDGNGKINNNNSGGSTSYTECTDFPYKKWCSSSVVSEIQSCLGLGADGKFGPKTEKTLKNKGYGTEITKEVYDKIKANCGSSSSSTTTTTTIPAPNFQDIDVDPDNIII